jgi:hypothetical protein
MSNILQLLQSRFPDGRTEGTSYTIKCLNPSCNTSQKHHLWITIDTGIAICWKCGFQTHSWLETKRKLKLNENVFVQDITTTTIKRFANTSNNTILPLGEYPCVGNIEAISFLSGRGISLNTIEKYNIGISSDEYNYKGYIIVPWKHIFITRALYEKKYYIIGKKENVIFNLPDTYSDSICVITEGAFDVLPDRLRTDVRFIPVAILGSCLTKSQRNMLLSRFNKFIVWLDPDAREKQQRDIYNALKNAGKEVKECYAALEPGDCLNPVDEYRRLYP